MADIVSKLQDSILFRGIPIYCTVDETTYLTPSDIDVKETDCGYEFTVKREGIITFIIPCGASRLRVGNELGYVDTNFTTQYYFPHTTDIIKRKYHIGNAFNLTSYPIIHVIEDEQCCSFSVGAENLITFFKMAYVQYASIATHSSGSVTFHLDISVNALLNLQRYPCIRPSFYIQKDLTDLPTITKAVFHGANIRQIPRSNIELLLERAREIQSTFLKNGIKSVIIGSCASRLNGIPVDVNDLDLMIPPDKFADAIALMDTLGDRHNIDTYRAKYDLNGVQTDITIDNYNLVEYTGYAKNRHGLTFLDTEGLLWIHLLLLYAISRNQFTKRSVSKNMDVLFGLSAKLKSVHDNSVQVDMPLNSYAKECVRLCDKLGKTSITPMDIRINDPFQMNCFKEEDDVYHFSIVNNGSETDARIVVGLKPKSAIFRDVAGRHEAAKIEIHDTFSLIFINKVFLPGVLSCVI